MKALSRSQECEDSPFLLTVSRAETGAKERRPETATWTQDLRCVNPGTCVPQPHTDSLVALLSPPFADDGGRKKCVTRTQSDSSKIRRRERGPPSPEGQFFGYGTEEGLKGSSRRNATETCNGSTDLFTFRFWGSWFVKSWDEPAYSDYVQGIEVLPQENCRFLKGKAFPLPQKV